MAPAPVAAEAPRAAPAPSGEGPSYLNASPQPSSRVDAMTWQKPTRPDTFNKRKGRRPGDMIRSWTIVAISAFAMGVVAVVILATINAEEPDQVGLVSQGQAGGEDLSPEAEAPSEATTVAPDPGPKNAPKEAEANEQVIPGVLRIRSNRPVLVYLDGRALGMTPHDHAVTPGTYEVSALIPGQPKTRQTRTLNVTKQGDDLQLMFQF